MEWLAKLLFGCVSALVIVFALIAVIAYSSGPTERMRLLREFREAEIRADKAEAEVREMEAKVRLRELRKEVEKNDRTKKEKSLPV